MVSYADLKAENAVPFSVCVFCVSQVSDDWPEDRAYLLNAFKQADVDMCGCLSVKEVEGALGKRVRGK